MCFAIFLVKLKTRKFPEKNNNNFSFNNIILIKKYVHAVTKTEK